MALARALITEPPVLLLDEPLSALDPFLRIRMRAELKRLQRELGITFIHVTHSQDEAMALADLVVVMNDGRIEQAGSAREVFNAPRTEFVARFMGGHNVLETPAGKIAVRADQISVAHKKPKGENAVGAVDQGHRVSGHQRVGEPCRGRAGIRREPAGRQLLQRTFRNRRARSSCRGSRKTPMPLAAGSH